ncbi:hypothetical protein A6X21_21175 [Planctopirus hydrillae]|uniref:DUF2997 domain-containing protein n=2 Tax=Planctopirus hydrillae TaxID=1841610 RepID=A0A1C3EGL6_9PLAN|nr:hypothetical protein A6X21_21175 [Planctopirus hydrillae]
MPPTLEVLVAPDGSVQVKAQGFTGTSCRTATQALIAALGLPTHEQLQPEFYVTASTHASQELSHRA